MGRKGVSKRKTRQSKSTPLGNQTTSDSISSIVQAADSQPVKLRDTSKPTTSTKGGTKLSSDQNKKIKKG